MLEMLLKWLYGEKIKKCNISRTVPQNNVTFDFELSGIKYIKKRPLTNYSF